MNNVPSRAVFEVAFSVWNSISLSSFFETQGVFLYSEPEAATLCAENAPAYHFNEFFTSDRFPYSQLFVKRKTPFVPLQLGK